MDDITQGMVLSEDVRDVSSRLLLSKGETLQPEHIRIFKIWGVCEVSIQGNHGREEVPEQPLNPELIEKTKEDTKLIFEHVDLDHPAIKELFRLAVLHRSRYNISNDAEKIRLTNSDNSKHLMAGDIQSKIDRVEIVLPEIPSIVFELNELIAAPFASANDIAQLVSKSPSLATLLLRIVNSAFYGFPSKIDSISRAVALIGSKEITNLALGVSIMELFQDIPKEIIDMHSFLKHSLACGIISRILAAHKNIKQTEQLFVSGLLHDIGRLIFFKYFPDHAEMLLSIAQDSDKPLYQIERSYSGVKHTSIAKYLLKKWKLPLSLENNIIFHHAPSSAHQSDKATIVHLADITVNSLGLGSSGERFIPNFDNNAWEQISLSPNIFEMIIKQAIHQLASLESFFQG